VTGTPSRHLRANAFRGEGADGSNPNSGRVDLASGRSAHATLIRGPGDSKGRTLAGPTFSLAFDYLLRQPFFLFQRHSGYILHVFSSA
jgi:hypothetical protein